MPTLEERVAYLEGKTEEHSRGFGELRDLVIHLDHKVNRFREELSGRMDALDQKIDRFREELSNRIDRVHTRINALTPNSPATFSGPSASKSPSSSPSSGHCWGNSFQLSAHSFQL